MNVQDFIKAIEQYFGRYPRPAIRLMVVVHIEQYGDLYRAALLEALIENVSSRFDRPPDVAEIVKHRAVAKAKAVDRKMLAYERFEPDKASPAHEEGDAGEAEAYLSRTIQELAHTKRMP